MPMNSLNQKPQKIIQQTIESDVADFIKGNQSSFRVIKERVEPFLNQILYSRFRHLCFAKREDIKQELWIEFIKKISHWNPQRGSLKSFTFWALRNRLSTISQQETRYSTRHSFTDQLEQIFADEKEPALEADLDIQVKTRITGPLIDYILRKVAVAVYHKSFEGHKANLIKDIGQMTHLPHRQISFFVDYSLVVIRRHCLEQ